MPEDENNGETKDQGTGTQGESGSGTNSFTQEQVSSMMAREKQQGRDAGRSALLKKLGFENEEDAEAAITAHREAQDRNRSEAEREKTAAAQEKAVATEEKTKARIERFELRVERALVGAGCDSPRAVKLVDLDYDGRGDVPDQEIVDAAVAALKKEMPKLFSTEESGNPDSDTGKASGKKTEKTSSEIAQDRLARYKQEHAAPMESYDDLVQRT